MNGWRRTLAGMVTVAMLTAVGGCTKHSDRSDGSPSSTGRSTGSSAGATTSSATTPTAATPTATGPTAVPGNVPRTGPNLSPGEQPPNPPEPGHDASGAVAFGRFFIHTLDWAYATTSTTYVRHYYAPSCEACEAGAQTIDEAVQADQHYVGARITVESAELITATARSGSERVVQVVTSVSAGQIVDSQGTLQTDLPAIAAFTYRLWIAWRDGAWTVVALTAS